MTANRSPSQAVAAEVEIDGRSMAASVHYANTSGQTAGAQVSSMAIRPFVFSRLNVTDGAHVILCAIGYDSNKPARRCVPASRSRETASYWHHPRAHQTGYCERSHELRTQRIRHQGHRSVA